MNWGWKLAIGSGLFMAMIIYFVARSFQNETQLVSKDYYEEELHFQDKMQATKNAKDLNDDIVISQGNGEIQISYPEKIEFGDEAMGTLHFYNVANGHSDKKMPCDFTVHNQVIPKAQLRPGRYMVRANIEANGKAYYFEKRLTVQ